MDEYIVDLAALTHEDKCCFWDDSEFCDCGAKEYEMLKQCRAERDRYKAALESIIRAECKTEEYCCCHDDAQTARNALAG